MVHPDSLTVKTPAVSLLAGGITILLHHSHFSPRIHRARVPVHVVGRTRDRVALVRSVVSVRVHHKIGPAAMVHPDSLTVKTPAVSLLAGRITILFHHAHSCPRLNPTHT